MFFIYMMVGRPVQLAPSEPGDVILDVRKMSIASRLNRNNPVKDYFQASMMPLKSAALRAAPPIRPPSTFSFEVSSSALPVWTGIAEDGFVMDWGKQLRFVPPAAAGQCGKPGISYR